MTFRRRLEHLEGSTSPPVDEAAVDAEIRQLLHELSTRDPSTRVQWHEGSRRTPEEAAVDREIQALLDAMRARP